MQITKNFQNKAQKKIDSEKAICKLQDIGLTYF